MNRRNLLKYGMTTAGVMFLLPALAKAQEASGDLAAPTEEIAVTSEIASNHGHELVLSAVDALKLLRSTRNNGSATLDIKGRSGHPHALVLTHDDLLLLFDIGLLQVNSTMVAGHAHAVVIHLDVVPGQA